ncbi:MULTISPECIES: TetR/AcrR family transcriptional regulator [Spongiibacter]|jgi:AcrR family transcriptional regulator|uniref:TetR/AcrR family transcriptional regulator n=1 Tax=Spongiibacter TaxID=630749 RepID=UPI0003B3628E|nr:MULTISPECIES: TetR/AcrR family transcriptional regulator [Spongiibacter]MAY38708.1 TetR/AcrR family transcriptional regulator [Spongiibacter sp.]MBI57179.1 TetR/AcrR family transcriptional regulator [Spongiibacter sp.]MBO6752840.1 TetR/AcrR family transcriptional regulator [Spongiibacter sp.]MBU73519.1 TetR/AcrR family transcriptional regulator [Spongiibacter sp.]|tara:strand:+ start:7353 stop:7931 length:579 start_codon:yes stop_codon:yes gene_type:complete
MKTNKRWGSGARVDDLKTGKKLLLEAAVSCFTAKGVKSTTIEDIANVANVTRRTVYRYFTGKADIIEALVDIERSRMFERLESVVEQYRDDFPQMLEECIWFAANYMPEEDSRLEFTSGRNATEIMPHLDNAESDRLWRELLREPVSEYNRSTGKSVSLDDLVPLAGRLALIYRQHPVSKEDFHASLRALRF